MATTEGRHSSCMSAGYAAHGWQLEIDRMQVTLGKIDCVRSLWHDIDDKRDRAKVMQVLTSGQLQMALTDDRCALLDENQISTTSACRRLAEGL